MTPLSSYSGKLTINLSSTEYEILGDVAVSLKWKKNYDPEDTESDVIWQDGPLLPAALSSLRPFQRINHFAGMYAVARKDYLGRHLKHMQKFFENEYNFFPQTWVLPKDISDFKTQFNRKKIYIVKPEALSQGQGIFLTRKLEDICLLYTSDAADE